MSDELQAIALRALDYVRDGNTVGLGTGRAATRFIRALGARVNAGLRVQGVPTSSTTARLAGELGIPLVGLGDVPGIDVTVDGADEVNPALDLIKGWGGALVREKIVAAYSRQRVILVGAEKLVDQLGKRGMLPVEVVPFGLPLAERELGRLGLRPVVRQKDRAPFVTDNGNVILDCGIDPIQDPSCMEQNILAIPGVVECGLFLGMADVVLIEGADGVTERRRAGSS